MVRFNTRHINELALLLAVCAGSALGLLLGNGKRVTAKAPPLSVSRQSSDKLIQISQRPDEPLEFGNLSIRNAKITPGRKFNAASLAARSAAQGTDWLDNLEFNLKNRSDKQITYIVFELQFPDTEVSGPLMVYRELSTGVPSRASGGPLRSDDESPLALKPGDTTTVKLSAKHLERIKHFIGLRNFRLSEMNTVVVKILVVTFDDGMKWSSGYYMKPNPNVAGGYERVNQ